MDPLYAVNVECSHCKKAFSTSKVRPSFKKPIEQDTDFYKEYKGINPDYYVARVCPHCGFASTENFTVVLTPQDHARIDERVSANWKFKDFGGERSREQALMAFKLALLCAQITGEKDRIVAGLLHHIAWIYRSQGMKQLEKKFLGFALEAYVKVFELEGIDLNNARLMYVIGELNRRIGNYHEAVRWFSRVIEDKRISDASMIRASREQWGATREDMLAARLELPDEMKELKK